MGYFILIITLINLFIQNEGLELNSKTIPKAITTTTSDTSIITTTRTPTTADTSIKTTESTKKIAIGKNNIDSDNIFRENVIFSKGCDIHPTAKIIAESGPIIFGENCIVGKHSTIIFKIPENLKNKYEPVLNIGANNIFGPGCTVKALKIGDRNIIGPQAYISENVEISNNCIISPNRRLEQKSVLADNTII